MVWYHRTALNLRFRSATLIELVLPAAASAELCPRRRCPSGDSPVIPRRLPDVDHQIAFVCSGGPQIRFCVTVVLSAPGPAHFRWQGASLAVAPPETRRSTSDRGSEVLRGVSGECPARPARATGAVSERIAGGLIMVIWQPHHQGLSASHCHPGTSVAGDSQRRQGAKSLLGVQICIPGSDGVRPPWCMGVLRQFSRCSCTSASSSPPLKSSLAPLQGILTSFCIQRALRCVRVQIRCWRLDVTNPAPRVLREIIQRAGHALAALLEHRRVNHRGGHVGMTQQFLDGADVRAALHATDSC